AAALPLPAHQLDLAAEQARQLPADGESEARTPEFPACRAVRLPERLENQFLLVLGYADPAVGDGKNDPILIAGPGFDPDKSSRGSKLERVGYQVPEDLRHAHPVGLQRGRSM